MKKFIKLYLLVQLIVCIYTTSCMADYYDLEHYQVSPDTIAVTNDINFRGDFKLYSDTYTVRFASMTPGVIFYATGTVDVSTIKADTVMYKSTTSVFSVGVTFSSWTVFNASSAFTNDTVITATKKHYFSVDGDTYITESADKTISIEAEAILKPSQPCTRAYLNSDQDDITDITLTKILLDAETYDVGSNFDTVDSSYTVPVTGYYQIVSAVQWEGADLTNDKSVQSFVKINSSYYLSAIEHINNSGLFVTNIATDILYLTAGDEVTLWGYTTMGHNNADIDASKTFLIIRLIQ